MPGPPNEPHATNYAGKPFSDDEQSQAERLRDADRDVGADTFDDALVRVFGKLDLKRKTKADEKPVKNDDKRGAGRIRSCPQFQTSYVRYGIAQ